MIKRSKCLVLNALLLALCQPAAAQVLAVSPPSADTATSRHPVLLKLGTGLTRGLQKQRTSLSLLAVPITAGVEYQWRPDWTLYANGFGGVSMNMLEDEARPTDFLYLGIVGSDLGVRHYYHQARRRQKGRAHGAFHGNYLACQTTTSWHRTSRYQAHPSYEYTTLAAFWGMQRRLGCYGLLDAHLGPSLRNPQRNATAYRSARTLQLAIEASVKISLAW